MFLEIVKWLRQIELDVHNVYLNASRSLSDDLFLHDFLLDNAEDEIWHYHIMGSAITCLSENEIPNPIINVDSKIKQRIQSQITEIENIINQPVVDKNDLVEKILSLELSEWNDVFLYVLNCLVGTSQTFKIPAEKIQEHLRKLEYTIEHQLNQPDILKKIYEIPSIWQENILIVDDEMMIAEFIKSILHRNGNIDIATNGLEALEKLEEKKYRLIVSDIDMPEMNGLDFFKKAREKDHYYSKRFIFMSGNLTEERMDFIKEFNLVSLAKPFDISTLKKEATKILLQNNGLSI